MHIEKKSAHSHHSAPQICRVTNPTRTIHVFSSQNSEIYMLVNHAIRNKQKAYNHRVRVLSEQREEHDVEHHIENIYKKLIGSSCLSDGVSKAE
jgi:hypothetical protein